MELKILMKKQLLGVGVTITGREMNKVTDNEGTMILTNLPMGSEMLFDVNTGIMPDITMKGGKMAKRRMVLLSGATHVIMLPIIQTTEIDGTLAVKQGDTQIPMGNVQIKLIDKENRVVQTTKTSSDGYYIFSEVPHGVYKVKLDDKEVKRYKDYLVEYHD